ncbi:MAG: deoxyribodipyrimidine photolyase [Planctomycetia bacterium]|nr:deoxyribodipyrimidine photolyase [Planctomycetia bacterium]
MTPLAGLPRDELAAALAAAFPLTATGPGRGSRDAAARGGRRAALERLAAIDPVAYERTRNHVSGAVTRLSPWIRHGVLGLAEVRDAALARVDRPEQAAKLVSELGWRDYWRQVQSAVGDAIHADIESPAATSNIPQLDRMPDDVLEARTGMACIDAFVRRLSDTGWLHNHERMWLASWLVHARGVRWQTGADWFLEHLLDGDPASNHLSWQWVAGTFSAKPYIFNRENLESFTSGEHCRTCPVLGRCELEGSYEGLDRRFFVAGGAAVPRPPLRIRPRQPAASTPVTARPLVWLTLDSAAATSPAAAAFPESPRLFVVDDAWFVAERPSLKRLVFLFECLAEISGVEIVAGDPRTVVPARAAALNCDAIAVAETSCPRVRAAVTAIGTELPVRVVPWPAFCDRSRVTDLGRFSRYWQQVSRSAVMPTHTAHT